VAYIFTYINPHKQFGLLSVELLLEDDASIMPSRRQWMTFKDEDDKVMASAADIIAAEAVKQAEDKIIYDSDREQAALAVSSVLKQALANDDITQEQISISGIASWL
jgi:hypothetical protein